MVQRTDGLGESPYEAPIVTDLGRIEDITQMPKGGAIADGQGNAKSQ